MADEIKGSAEGQDASIRIGELTVTQAENPMILDQVDYAYVSYSQFMVSNTDFRLAFGDRRPPDGKVKPLFGIVMSNRHARDFFRALKSLEGAFDKVEQHETRGAPLNPPPEPAAE